MKKILLLLIIAAAAFSGCERNPAGALIYPDVKNSSSWGNEWVIYGTSNDNPMNYDELASLGSWIFPMYTTWGTDEQPNYSTDLVNSQLNIDYAEPGVAHRGRLCMRVSWDGSAFLAYDTGALQNGYVGFAIQSSNTVNGVDISASGYTTLKFWVKGTLASDTKLTVKTGDGGPGGAVAIKELMTIPTSWTEVSVPLVNFTSVKELFIVVFDNTNTGNPRPDCGGGTVYFDDIRYTK